MAKALKQDPIDNAEDVVAQKDRAARPVKCLYTKGGKLIITQGSQVIVTTSAQAESLAKYITAKRNVVANS